MQRLVNVALPLAGNEMFKAGFGEGLTDLFNTSSESLTDLIPLFKGLGRILGSVFHAIAKGLQLITAPLRLVGELLDRITEVTGKWSYLVSTGLAAGLVVILSRMGKFTKFVAALRLGFLAMLALL